MAFPRGRLAGIVPHLVLKTLMRVRDALSLRYCPLARPLNISITYC